MKSLVTLVVLCTALFVTLDAAPVLPSGYEADFEAVGRQQSDEMAKTFLNVFSKILTAASDRIGKDGSIQADNAFGRAFLNLASSFLSSASKKADPNDELQQSLFNGFNSIFSLIGKQLGDDGGEIQSNDEMAQTFMNLFGTLLSAMTKKIDNGEIQSFDEIAPAFLNLMGNMLSAASKNVDPNDKVAQTVLNGFSTLLSAFGRKISNGGSQIQSNNELTGAVLNLLGNLGSALQKKANPKDDLAQTFLSLFNTVVSGAKNRIDGGQEEVHVDTLPTYTAKRFDQSMLESTDENAAVVEADMDITDEAKAQLWGAVLRTLGPIVLKRVLDG